MFNAGNMIYNLPMLLTLFRLVFSISILPFLLVNVCQQDNFQLNILFAVLFLGVCFTDFLDGYFARRNNQVTRLGKLLDPIADKFLLLAALIALLVVQKIHYWFVIILLGREMFVLALRLIALEEGIDVPVSKLAKYKTASQMMLITFLVMRPSSFSMVSSYVEFGLLSLVMCLSLVTAFNYSVNVLKKRYRKIT